MIDILQPTSLIPYANETPKIEAVNKPAVIIPINAEVNLSLKKNIPLPEAVALPFEEWSLPVQEEGYLKGRGFDFL